MTPIQPGSLPENKFVYTNSWFNSFKETWEQIIFQVRPKRMLEIGSYEGQSSCYLIETTAQYADIELHCIDTWEGSVEHQQIDMKAVEARFKHNTNLAIRNAKNDVRLTVHKSRSDYGLATLLADNKRNYFDFIYIDGSHQAADVLYDAVLSFRLLRVGGVLVFDDYLWSENSPQQKFILQCPKAAIDAFINLNFRKLKILSAPLYQIYIQKVSD